MNIINQETGEVVTLDLHSELMSHEISDLAKALVKAQGAMTSAKMDGSNPHFKSSYATLDSIWQAIRKPLCEHGLCVVQSLLPDNTLVTTLLHESGQWVRSYQRLNPVQNSPQGIGSALTYGRRYSLAAIVGICQADDDGEEGSATADKRLAGSPELGRRVPLGEKKPKPTQAPKPATVPQTPATKPTNGEKKATDPMTQYWAAVKEAELSVAEGQRILGSCDGDAVKALDALQGISQAQPT